MRYREEIPGFVASGQVTPQCVRREQTQAYNLQPEEAFRGFHRLALGLNLGRISDAAAGPANRTIARPSRRLLWDRTSSPNRSW
jgi:hypothetical protein